MTEQDGPAGLFDPDFCESRCPICTRARRGSPEGLRLVILGDARRYPASGSGVPIDGGVFLVLRSQRNGMTRSGMIASAASM